MELRQRKRIQNLPKYNDGFDYGQYSLDIEDSAHQEDMWTKLYQMPNYSFLQGSPDVVIENGLPVLNLGNKDFNQFHNSITNSSTTITKQNLVELQKKIPKQTSPINIDNFANKASAIANGATGITQSVIGNLNVKSQGELLADAGGYNGTIMGVGYRGQNDVDKDAELSGYDSKAAMNTLSSTTSGASAGAPFGPIGAAIGGAVGLIAGVGSWIGGKNKLRKRINNARNFATRTNIANKAGAMTTGLQNQYYSNNAYTQDDILYG